MKQRYINEQNQKTKQIGPKNEVNAFTTGVLSQGVFSGKPIEPLCRSNDSSLVGVTVGGKTYYTGKRVEISGTKAFILYDGLFIYKKDGSELGSNCKGYSYLLSEKGQPKHLQTGTSVEEFDAEIKTALSNFGIKRDELTNIYYILKEVTTELKTLVGKGAKSNIFSVWNSLLSWYFGSYSDMMLKTTDGSELNPPTSQQTLNQKYQPQDLSLTSGIKYKGSPFKIYVPNTVGQESTVGSTKRSPEFCRTAISKYLKNALTYTVGLSQLPTDVTIQKKELHNCYVSNNFNDFKPLTIDEVITKESNNDDEKVQLLDKLSPFGVLNKNLSFNEIKKILYGGKLFLTIGKKYNVKSSPYQLTNNELDLSNMNESVNLKSIIRNKLTVLSENKQKQFISESKIIKSRFNIISEAKISRDRIATKLIEESFDMVNLGMNEKLITENLMDTLKSMFGFGAEGVVQFFKEKLAEALLKKLTPIDTDGWFGGIIVKGIGDIPVGDWFNGKVFKCDYLVPAIAKAVTEEAIDKAKDKAGLTGGFYDILRNSLVQGLEDTSFGQSIERGLSTIICPLLTNVSGKMGDMFNTMKKKAIA